MKWKQPPIIKVYEALTAIADKRIEIDSENPNQAKCYSTSGNKFYTIQYDPEFNQIMSNDNSAYWTDTLSYPMIALLMIKGKIQYNPELLKPLSSIPWKDINQKFKNNYEKALGHVHEQLTSQGVDSEFIKAEVELIYTEVKKLELEPLGKKQFPPKAY